MEKYSLVENAKMDQVVVIKQVVPRVLLTLSYIYSQLFLFLFFFCKILFNLINFKNNPINSFNILFLEFIKVALFGLEEAKIESICETKSHIGLALFIFLLEFLIVLTLDHTISIFFI